MLNEKTLKYYAHTDPDNPGKLPEDGANWQLLEDHLKETAEMARQFTSAFGAGDWGYITGLLHDLGKFSNDFQAYLRRTCDVNAHVESKHGKVDHSSAGAQEIHRLLGLNGKLIAYCIAGHHSGLFDGSGQNGVSLNDRLKKDIPKVNPPKDLLSMLPEVNQPISIDAEHPGFQLYLLIKMLYSSLVDADFLNTEVFMSSKKSLCRGKFPKLSEIADTFRENIKKLLDEAESSNINNVRNGIYHDCLNARANASKFFYDLRERCRPSDNFCVNGYVVITQEVKNEKHIVGFFCGYAGPACRTNQIA